MAGSLGTIFVEMDIDRDRWSGAQRRLLTDATSTSLRIEDNFRKLGIKSSAEMDLMRMKITNSFDMIKNSSQATANDIVRAEKAKNEQLKTLNDQQFGHQESILSKLKNNWMAASAAIVAAWYAISRAVKAVGNIIMESARYETLGVVMETVGHNAGYSAAQMYKFAAGLEKAGISMTEARQSLTRMNQAQLDLTKSAQLARVAQDAAVIGMMNSSEAFNQLVYGIQSANVRVLRTIGINVSFEDSYKKMAKQLGRTKESFNESEKANIRMNAALEAGEVIAGTYEAAMETAGKQTLSLTRYFDNFKVLVGTAFLPVFAEVIFSITGGIKDINENLKKNLESAKDWGVGLRLILIDIQAEFMRFAMFIDKIGGTLTSAQMLLYGPGRLLGIESSTKRFEAAADANMAFENRYLETEKKLQEIANRYVALEHSITPGGKAKAAAIKEAEERLALSRYKPPAAESVQPAIDKEMLRLEEQAALMMAKSEETLVAKTDMEKFIESSLTDALYVMRQKRLEDQTGFAQKSLMLNQWQHDAALQIMQIERDEEIALDAERLILQEQFNKQYAELGKSQFDIERQNIQIMAEAYRQAGADKVQVAQLTAAKIAAISRAETDSKLAMFQNNASNISATFLQIAQAGGKQSKKAFEIYKAFAMVEAGISAARAIIMALGSPPGPPWSFITAGITAAMAAVQIGMIAKSEPPSYDQGGISEARGIYQTGDISEAHIPLQSGKVPVNINNGGSGGQTFIIKMENPIFQDVETQRQVFAQIAEVVARQVAPSAVVQNYNNDGQIRRMIRGRV